MEESSKAHGHGPAYNTQPAGLEKWVDKTVGGLPQIPKGGRKWLADNSWWLTLVGGVLSILGVWNVWQALQYVSQVGSWANGALVSYGVATPDTQLGLMRYIALGALLLQGALLLIAFQQLKEHKKSGWNLLFYSSLLGVVVGIAYALIPGYGVGMLVRMAIGLAISWYILFNIRSHFAR